MVFLYWKGTLDQIIWEATFSVKRKLSKLYLMLLYECNDESTKTGIFTMFLSFDVSFSASDALKGEGLQEGVDWLQGISYVILLLHFHSVKLFHFISFFLYYFLCFLFVHFCCQTKLHSEYWYCVSYSPFISLFNIHKRSCPFLGQKCVLYSCKQCNTFS